MWTAASHLALAWKSYWDWNDWGWPVSHLKTVLCSKINFIIKFYSLPEQHLTDRSGLLLLVCQESEVPTCLPVSVPPSWQKHNDCQQVSYFLSCFQRVRIVSVHFKQYFSDWIAGRHQRPPGELLSRLQTPRPVTLTAAFGNSFQQFIWELLS